MKVAKEKDKDQDQDQNQDQNIDPSPEQIKSLTCELLKERITRIDFQVQLLMQWRQGCQQELNHLLAGGKDSQSPEGSHG